MCLLSLHSTMPRQGHLEAALHIIGYLKLSHNSILVFDLSYPERDHSNFWEFDWTDFYESAVEAIPPDAPPPREKEVSLWMFVNSDNYGNKQMRRSRTSFIIYMNMSLIDWYYNKQSTIETSVFGTEFVAMKVHVETYHTIWCELRMMGITISGP